MAQRRIPYIRKRFPSFTAAAHDQSFRRDAAKLVTNFQPPIITAIPLPLAKKIRLRAFSSRIQKYSVRKLRVSRLIPSA